MEGEDDSYLDLDLHFDWKVVDFDGNGDHVVDTVVDVGEVWIRVVVVGDVVVVVDEVVDEIGIVVEEDIYWKMNSKTMKKQMEEGEHYLGCCKKGVQNQIHL